MLLAHDDDGLWIIWPAIVFSHGLGGAEAIVK